jgi:hypothetical protein
MFAENWAFLRRKFSHLHEMLNPIDFTKYDATKWQELPFVMAIKSMSRTI